jgi:vitamin B12 transporter
LEFAGHPFSVANVPLGFVDRVEVYQGVVPIRLGSDALGGAIDLISDRNVQRNRGHFSYQAGSFETQRLSGAFQWAEPKAGFVGRVSAFLDDTANSYPVNVNVPDAQGQLAPATVRRFHDHYGARGANVTLGVTERPWARRLLVHGFLHAFDKEVQSNPDMSVPYGRVDFDRMTAGGNVRYVVEPGAAVRLEATLGYAWVRTHFVDVSSCRYTWYGNCQVDLAPIRGEVQQIPVNRAVDEQALFVRSLLSWNASPEHTLRFSLAPTAGLRNGDDAELSGDEYDSLNSPQTLVSAVAGTEWEARLARGRAENVAFAKGYLQHQRGEQMLATGLDYPERFTTTAGVGDSLRVDLVGSWFAKGSYEYAVRLPSSAEVFGDGTLTERNLELSPERSHNVNLGIHLSPKRGHFGSVEGRVGGFGRFTSEQILLLRHFGSFLRYENVQDARTLGAEGLVSWNDRADVLTLGANALWQDSRNVSTSGPFAEFNGDKIPHRPYFQVSADARVRFRWVFFAGDELSLTWNSFFVHEFYRGWQSAGTEATKAKVGHQLTHSLAVTHKYLLAGRSLTTSLESLNLTDERVSDYWGAQRPGRSFSVKVTWAFDEAPKPKTETTGQVPGSKGTSP